MQKIYASDITNAKKIQMYCPYCGDLHDMHRRGRYFIMKCEVSNNYPFGEGKAKVRVGIVTEDDESVVKALNITYNYPCCYTCYKELTSTINISEVKKVVDDETIEIGTFIYLPKLRKSDKCGAELSEFTRSKGISEYSNCKYKCGPDCDIMMEPFPIVLKITSEKIQKQVEKAHKQAKKESKTGGEKRMTMLAMDNINKMSEELGIKFGVNTDSRIQSTILGTVVEYTEGKFRGFDRESKLMTEYSNLATISLPSILIPSITVKEGDTIIHSGEPLFIVKADEGDVWGANPLTSKEEKVLPISNPLGIKTYTRLISVGEIMGFRGNNPQNTRITLWLLTMVANKVFSEGIDSANEKIKEVTEHGEKYLEVLAPFACVAFAAYAMKGDDMKLDNIGEVVKDTLGIDLDCLKDKKNLKRIAAIGVATTAAVTYFKGKVKKVAAVEEYDEKYDEEYEEQNKEEVTKGIDKLLKAIKPWESTIQKVLPAAIAICGVAIFKKGEKIQDIKDKLEGFLLLAKDVVCEKLGIDEDVFNKENLKKFVALIGIAITVFMVYGKKLNNKNKNAEEANGMIKQIVPVIAPLIPAAIVFAPELKSLFQKYGYCNNDDFEDFKDVDFDDNFSEVDEEEMSKEAEDTEELVKSEEVEVDNSESTENLK